MEDAPVQPKLTRSRSKKVEISDEPEVKAIEPRPRSRSKKAQDPEPIEQSEPVQEPVKIKKPRKKPEPGSRPPKEVSFNSARGPINFTAHRVHQPYAHLHGVNRFSNMMANW